MENVIKGKIICSAIWYKDGKVYVHQPNNVDNGYVWCGRRHHNIINLRKQLIDEDTWSNHIQGFLTSDNYFLGRNQARRHAIEIGQLKEEDCMHSFYLFSEDLY